MPALLTAARNGRTFRVVRAVFVARANRLDSVRLHKTSVGDDLAPGVQIKDAEARQSGCMGFARVRDDPGMGAQKHVPSFAACHAKRA